MDAWGDAPGWKKALKPLAPASLRPWLSYAYWVLPQKAWTAAACAARLPLAQEPKWPEGRRKINKALMVAQQFSYGEKKAGVSYEFAHLFAALKENVKEARFFDSLGTEKNLDKAEINRQMEELVAQFKPDLVLLAPFRDELEQEMVRRVSETSGAVTTAWFFDDLWRFDIFSRGWGRAVHAIATQDKASMEKWAKLGHRHQYFTPFGYTPAQYHPVKTAMERDVGFVGAAGHPGRREAVAYLRAQGQDVRCFGNGWEKGIFADLDQLPKIFCSSKINLNFSRVSVLWEGKRQVKGRVFEVTGCGGFLLTEYAPGLDELFEIGKEIDAFRTQEEMAEKVKYYLAHEKERAAIANAGLLRAQKDHTYAKRLGGLLQSIQNDWPS